MDTTLSTTLAITPQNEQQRLALVQGQAFLNGTLDHNGNGAERHRDRDGIGDKI